MIFIHGDFDPHRVLNISEMVTVWMVLRLLEGFDSLEKTSVTVSRSHLSTPIAVQCWCLSSDPSWTVGTGFCSQCTFLWEQLIAPYPSQMVTFPQPIFNHNIVLDVKAPLILTVYCLLASHHALYNDVVLQWKMLVLFCFRPTSDLGTIHLLFFEPQDLFWHKRSRLF